MSLPDWGCTVGRISIVRIRSGVTCVVDYRGLVSYRGDNPCRYKTVQYIMGCITEVCL